jgi:hypothetical protein
MEVDGGLGSAVVNRVRFAWNKIRELRPFLAAKGIY